MHLAAGSYGGGRCRIDPADPNVLWGSGRVVSQNDLKIPPPESFSHIPGKAGNIESKWIVFHPSIVEVADRCYGRKVGSGHQGDGMPWYHSLRKEWYQGFLARGTPEAARRYQRALKRFWTTIRRFTSKTSSIFPSSENTGPGDLGRGPHISLAEVGQARSSPNYSVARGEWVPPGSYGSGCCRAIMVDITLYHVDIRDSAAGLVVVPLFKKGDERVCSITGRSHLSVSLVRSIQVYRRVRFAW